MFLGSPITAIKLDINGRWIARKTEHDFNDGDKGGVGEVRNGL